MRQRIGVAGLLLAALFLAACGGGGQQGGGEEGGGAAGAVDVTEHEWAIEMPAELQAGQVTFTIKNTGAVEHNFVIKETGQRVDGIDPGAEKTLAANLSAGTYTIVCDIPGHEEAGMTTTVTVK